jgi:hypothetical protein
VKYIKTENIKISDLIMDWNIYPRHEVDRVRLGKYYDAMQAGVEFPPIIIDAKTKKIIDGFHRTEAFKKLKYDEITAEFYEFESDAEMVFWGISWNAQHGLTLSQYDQSRCLNIGRDYGLTDEQIANALCITIDKITKMEKSRIRINVNTGRPVEIKRVLASITSETVTQKQINVQKPFNCMSAGYYIKRACDVLKHGLLQTNEVNIADVELLSKECAKWLKANRLKQVN